MVILGDGRAGSPSLSFSQQELEFGLGLFASGQDQFATGDRRQVHVDRRRGSEIRQSSAWRSTRCQRAHSFAERDVTHKEAPDGLKALRSGSMVRY